jgi:hypothetical protein
MKAVAFPLTAALAFVVSGCGEVVPGVEEDAGSVAQFEANRPGAPGNTVWTVLVVDDAPTEAARSMRVLVAEGLRGFFDKELGGCGAWNADPAAYRPIDQRLIVVGASGTLEPRFRDEEGLHAVGVDASPELLAAYEEAARQAILEMETSEVLPFVGVAELAHFVNLIEGNATPRSSVEEELLGSRPEGAVGYVWQAWAALSRTRPDESPAHPAAMDKDRAWSLNLLYWPEDGTCPPLPGGQAQVPTLEAMDARWTSPACFEEANVLTMPTLAAKCTPWCLPWMPALDDEGRATCRVYGEFWNGADCEEMPGWTFLESTLGALDGHEVNLCELRQSEGDALEACVNDFGCDGCEPSFCFRRAFTEADEGDPAHQRPVPAADHDACDSTGRLPTGRLRIVHGAEQFHGTLRVVCQK